MNSSASDDSEFRRAAFRWLEQQSDVSHGVLARAILEKGFHYLGAQVRLVGPQGIFKPRCMSFPLSITTSPNSPYSDAFGEDQLLRYKYRGTNPDHHENVSLRQMLLRQIPLVYLHGIEPGSYVAVWPVFIVADEPNNLTFTVAVDDPIAVDAALATHAYVADASSSAPRRGYITQLVRRRLHQQAFRERVLSAYRQQCALCHLKHRALLDAAHIIPDSASDGLPEVSNGLSLCKLHHAAFDHHFLGITPDYKIEIRGDLMKERDGPMLKHGLQGMHGQSIILPSRMASKPDRERLALRYKLFQDQQGAGQ